MPGKAVEVTVTDSLQGILHKITRETTAGLRLVQRARIILLASEGLNNKEIAEQVQLDRRQVGCWRSRWRQSLPALDAIEQDGNAAGLRRAVEDVLSDAPRPGSPGTFTAEQVVGIIAVACESPALSDRPITHWTGHELAEEVVKRRLVKSISVSQVNRYLRAAALQPHRSRY